MKIKRTIMHALPKSWQRVLHELKRRSIRTGRSLAEAIGYNVARKADYYSPLPNESALKRHESRWNRPSSMAGVSFDIDLYKRRLSELF